MTDRTRATPYNYDYPTCERTYSELRVYSDSLTPSKIEMLLGLSPTSSQEKGASWISSRGTKKQNRINGWFLSSDQIILSKDLRHHLDWLICKLEPAGSNLKKLQKMDCSINIHCVWWSVHGDGGPTLWPEQMLALAKLNLECSFDICFYGD